MKRCIYIICVGLITNNLSAQNTGIGTTAPTEKLDVNGNLNVSGNIKINNTAGQYGQVLMTNNAGATVWTNLSDYKNFVSFSFPGLYSWMVPAGVTKIFVEGWGGGGGGATGGGGGGGGYVMSVIPVISATNVSITVGERGEGATSVFTAGTSGTNSLIEYGSVQVYAFAGSAAAPNEPGFAGSVGYSSGSPFIGYSGETGHPTTDSYGYYNSTTFYTATIFGDGGDAAMAPLTGGKGAFRSYNTTTLSNFRLIHATAGGIPGGGGGGGHWNASFGRMGSWGMVIIRW